MFRALTRRLCAWRARLAQLALRRRAATQRPPASPYRRPAPELAGADPSRWRTALAAGSAAGTAALAAALAAPVRAAREARTYVRPGYVRRVVLALGAGGAAAVLTAAMARLAGLAAPVVSTGWTHVLALPFGLFVGTVIGLGILAVGGGVLGAAVLAAAVVGRVALGCAVAGWGVAYVAPRAFVAPLLRAARGSAASGG